MANHYQWIKFATDTEFGSTDFKAGEWLLVEMESDVPDGCITLFGVEYTMQQSSVSEWGPTVQSPSEPH